MRQRLQKWGMLIALIAANYCWLSCSADQSVSDGPYTLTVEASKATGEGLTRGLSGQGGAIAAIWNADDQVTVQNAAGKTIGTMTPLQTGTATTKLRAELTNTVGIGDKLRLLFPRTGQDYTGQVGTLADIAAKYDYAEATVEVTNIFGEHVTTSDAKFANQQAIVKFLLRRADGVTPVNASSLTISATGLKTSDTTTGDLIITPPAATHEIYAALSGISNQSVTLKAAVGSSTYTYTTTSPKSFDNSKSYTVTVKMTPPEPTCLEMPLTLECADDDATVTVLNGQLEYSKNGSEWRAFDENQLILERGDKVSFRGDNGTQTSPHTRIVCLNGCYVYGNVMSLVFKKDFATKTELPYDQTFNELFKDNADLTHKDGYDLILPATTLRTGCYAWMFSGCMKLNHVVCLATDISAEDCTYQWLYNVAETGTFVKAASMTSWPSGDNGIPTGWTTENYK